MYGYTALVSGSSRLLVVVCVAIGAVCLLFFTFVNNYTVNCFVNKFQSLFFVGAYSYTHVFFVYNTNILFLNQIQK